MAIGANLDAAPLWKLRVKINTPDGGLNWSLHMAETAEASARSIAGDVCNRLRAIMPSVCEIFAATISKDNTKKDSRSLPEAIGPGLYGQGGVSPPASTYNRFDDSILVRLENDDGGQVACKIAPVPDAIIVAGDIADPITNVSGIPVGVVPATAAQPVVYKTEFNNLMATIVKYCHHVSTKNHVPGGAYTYFPFKNAIVQRVAKKKGGRVSTK